MATSGDKLRSKDENRGLVSDRPRVSYKVENSALHIGGEKVTSGGHISGQEDRVGKGRVGFVDKENSSEKEEKEEGGGWQASRAAVTFALMQTEDKTHTMGDDDEGGDENATRAAPFTMASQLQGISALSDVDDDQDNR